MPKCPRCGEPFEGKPAQCPNCFAKFAYSVPKKPEPTEEPTRHKEKKRVLKTNRSLLKCIFLPIITLGIYYLVFITCYGRDLNALRVYYGFKKRFGFWQAFFLSLITLGIPAIVFWFRMIIDTYRCAGKAGAETKGSIPWVILAHLLLGWTLICPLIAEWQLYKTMNRTCAAYNVQ